MSWQTSAERWARGKFLDKESYSDVENWLLGDPVWLKGIEEGLVFIDWGGPGSKEATIRIPNANEHLPFWDKDRFQMSKSGGQWMKKWQIQQLHKAFKLVEETLEIIENEKK